MTTVYLSGPIYKDNKPATEEWREQARIFLEATGFKTISPCRNRLVYDASAFTANEITARDQSDIHRSDILLVNGNPVGDHLSWGTAMEIQLAHDQGKPIVIWSTDRRVVGHPWVKSYMTRQFNTLTEALLYLKQFWGD